MKKEVVYCDRVICGRKAEVRGRYETKVHNFCKKCASQLAGWRDDTIDSRTVNALAERLAEFLGEPSGAKVLKKHRRLITDGYFAGKHVGDLLAEIKLLEGRKR